MDSAREVCLVQFEDDSQFLVLWKDISPGEILEAWEWLPMEDRNLAWGREGGLRTGSLTLCSFIAALPGEEFLCCVCRSETVVPGNRLVSCEKCRHGERAGHLSGPACPRSSGRSLTLPTSTGPMPPVLASVPKPLLWPVSLNL